MKSTSVTINGQRRAIFKDPITDDGTKKSALGRVCVVEGTDDRLEYIDESNHRQKVEPEIPVKDLLTTIFKDGKFIKTTSLSEIKEKLREKVSS